MTEPESATSVDAALGQGVLSPRHHVEQSTSVATLAAEPAVVRAVEQTAAPLSPRTDEITRPALVVAADSVLVAGAVSSGIALVHSLMVMTSGNLPLSGWLVARIDPQPSSWQAVLMPLMNATLLAPAAAAALLAGFHAWNGKKWARNWGIVAVLWSLLGLLVGGPLTWAAIACDAVGAALLWLPPLTRYNRAQTALRLERERPASDVVIPDVVEYGPLPRYR